MSLAASRVPTFSSICLPLPVFAAHACAYCFCCSSYAATPCWLVWSSRSDARTESCCWVAEAADRRLAGAHAPRVEADQVEPLGQVSARPRLLHVRHQLKAGATGAARVDQERADPVGRVAGADAHHRDGDRGRRGLRVVQRDGQRRALQGRPAEGLAVGRDLRVVLAPAPGQRLAVERGQAAGHRTDRAVFLDHRRGHARALADGRAGGYAQHRRPGCRPRRARGETT